MYKCLFKKGLAYLQEEIEGIDTGVEKRLLELIGNGLVRLNLNTVAHYCVISAEILQEYKPKLLLA